MAINIEVVINIIEGIVIIIKKQNSEIVMIIKKWVVFACFTNFIMTIITKLMDFTSFREIRATLLIIYLIIYIFYKL